MNPAWSVIFFTTLAGAAQGLVVALAVAVLAGLAVGPGFLLGCLGLAVGMLVLSLVASFFHLGHPERAWRAAMMWRTSWLSREVIVLPAFIGVVVLWAAVLGWGGRGGTLPPALATTWLPWAAIALAALLWLCTAMIYACIRFIQEWAHPLTLANYVLIGLASGLVLLSALAALAGETRLLAAAGPWAMVATLVAGGVRTASIVRNTGLKPKSTLQSATGIRSERLVQRAMGMSGGAFNTREFFHGVAWQALRRIKAAAIVFGFVLPLLALVWAVAGGGTIAWVLALLLQAPGLVAERWFFFAQARHPQNLYYQVVS